MHKSHATHTTRRKLIRSKPSVATCPLQLMPRKCIHKSFVDVDLRFVVANSPESITHIEKVLKQIFFVAKRRFLGC
jgi:hypothetical protein